MEINTQITNQITRSQMTMICNTIRSLGLSFGLTGTRLINKVIQILVIKDLEIVILEDVYKELSNYYPNIKPSQMRKQILYALQHRDYYKAKENFEKIFGFEYDEDFFTNKKIIEEIANLIKLESI